MARDTRRAHETEKEIFATRLSERMKEKGLNQTTLSDRIVEQSGQKIQRQTISQYCNGQSKPDTERLVLLCNALDISADWLLGMSDIKSRDHDVKKVCEYTGLSEESSTILSNLHNWGLSSTQRTLDVLLRDASYHNIGNVNGKPYRYRSILDLIHIFLIYRGSGEKKHIFPSGKIVQPSDDGWIDSGAIELNDRVIENAILMELQQALISLKENQYKK